MCSGTGWAIVVIYTKKKKKIIITCLDLDKKTYNSRIAIGDVMLSHISLQILPRVLAWIF